MIPRITIKNRWIPTAEDERDRMSPGTRQEYPQLWDETCEVEVLSVHFQKNTMRVRFVHGLMSTQDIPADEFFGQVDIKAK